MTKKIRKKPQTQRLAGVPPPTIYIILHKINQGHIKIEHSALCLIVKYHSLFLATHCTLCITNVTPKDGPSVCRTKSYQVGKNDKESKEKTS